MGYHMASPVHKLKPQEFLGAGKLRGDMWGAYRCDQVFFHIEE